jgi:hypothetical protein
MTYTRIVAPTPLALFVNRRLAELKIRQADFCRVNMFDQGLLSKVQNSVVTNLSLESVLRLAAGLSVSPKLILELLGRMDLHELILRSYEPEMSEMVNERLRNSYSQRASGSAGSVPPPWATIRDGNQ